VIDETNAALTFEKSSRNIISKSAGKQGHAVKISHRSALQSFPIAGAYVLQCVAVCCSVLQCAAVRDFAQVSIIVLSCCPLGVRV